MEQETKKYFIQRGSDKKNIVAQKEWHDQVPPGNFYWSPGDSITIEEINAGRGYGITASAILTNRGMGKIKEREWFTVPEGASLEERISNVEKWILKYEEPYKNDSGGDYLMPLIKPLEEGKYIDFSEAQEEINKQNEKADG